MSRRRPKDAQMPFPVEFWDETAGWPIGERFMGAYLMTCRSVERTGRLGLFPMTPEAIDHAQPQWSMPRILRALDGLEARGELVRDAGWFFLERVLVRSHPRGRDQIKGALDAIELAPRHSMLWVTFMVAAGRHAPEFAAALDAAGRECPPTGGSARGVVAPSTGSFQPVVTDRRQGVDTLSTPRPRLEGTPGAARDTTPRRLNADGDDGAGVRA